MSRPPLSETEIRAKLWQGLRQWATGRDRHNGFSIASWGGLRPDGSATRDEIAVAEEAMWQWAVSGILRLFKASSDSYNMQFQPTKFGEVALRNFETPNLSPYDPDGYIRDLEKEVGTLDPVVVTYLDQAMKCFHAHAFLASMVMLGAASEQVILLVMARFPWIKAPKERESIGPKFAQLLVDIKNWPRDKKDRVKAATRPDWDHRLESGFNIIRVSRNEAGHPELVQDVDQSDVLGHFLLFRSYVRTAYDLMRFLEAEVGS